MRATSGTVNRLTVPAAAVKPSPRSAPVRPADWPAVSVSVLTYNQRHLIGRALDSILMQEVDFTYEIIVGDDCSDDGTQEVLREYARRYPDRITLILHPRRYPNEVPGRTNNVTNLLACRGKYTAMLDGDDYWTSPTKLQEQYDRLEADPSLSMCLHNSTIIREAGAPRHLDDIATTAEHGRIRSSGRYTHADVAQHGRLFAQIGTILFRTRIFGDFPEYFYHIVPADYVLKLLISKHGDVYYDARCQAVYRINATNFVSTHGWQPRIIERRIADIELLSRHFPAMNGTNGHRRSRGWMYYRLAKVYWRRRELKSASRSILRMLRNNPEYPVELIRNAWLHLRFDSVG